MRVCLLGSAISSEHDEGMRNIAYHYEKRLTAYVEVLLLDGRNILQSSFWKQIKAFRPDIIHYIAGPTIASLLLLRVLKLVLGGPKTAVSALHPLLPPVSQFFIRILSPDLVILQSERTRKLFRKSRCPLVYMANGVDLDKFVPVEDAQKKELRRKFRLDEDAYIFLHVGAIKQGRGVEKLALLSGPGQVVLLVGSVTTGFQEDIRKKLQQEGLMIWQDYFPQIEEIYALADCYVFTVDDPLNAIEIPLSVLEAQACNLPVVSTPFGGLPEMLPEDDTLRYFDTPAEMLAAVEYFRHREEVDARFKVQSFSWHKLVEQLNGYYEELIAR